MISTEVEELITISTEGVSCGHAGGRVRALRVGGRTVAGGAHFQDGHRSHGSAPAREARDRGAASVLRHAGAEYASFKMLSGAEQGRPTMKEVDEKDLLRDLVAHLHQ